MGLLGSGPVAAARVPIIVSEAPQPYRPEFVAALEKIAEACSIMKARGQALPILVGGAVVEFDTGSAIASGDFDFVADNADGFAGALLAVGFRREDRQGRLLRGFHHPDLIIGVELVSGGYFDGAADRQRIRIVELASGEVWAAPTEDLIADRLGQWLVNRADKSVLLQALTLPDLGNLLDTAYLDRRIRHETNGELDLAAVRRLQA